MCSGAAGLSFIAGSTEDGDSGMVSDETNVRTDLTDYSSTELGALFEDAISFVTGLLLDVILDAKATKAEMDCQKEKQIAIAIDEVQKVLPNQKAWNLDQPVHITKIGQVAILALPLEVTTMAGRRLEKEIKKVLPDVTTVLVNAQSNGTGLYLTTRQEYAAQQYEGGATLLGPFELNAITQIVHDLAQSFKPGVDLPDYGVTISDVEKNLETAALFTTGTTDYDSKPTGKEYGDVLRDVNPQYQITTDPTDPTVVTVAFVGANPNNDPMPQQTFLQIQRTDGPSPTTVANDWDPETRFIWTSKGVNQSEITVEWHVPMDAEPGEYRDCPLRKMEGIRFSNRWRSAPVPGRILPFHPPIAHLFPYNLSGRRLNSVAPKPIDMYTVSMFHIVVPLAAALLAALLYGQYKRYRLWSLGFKTILSCLFVVVGLLQAGVDPTYSNLVLGGLVLGMVGDVLLAIETPNTFKAGLVSFLAGHVMYIIAFVSISALSGWLSIAMVPIALFGMGSFLWLRRHLGKMLVPVSVYIGVICVMLLASLAVLGFEDISEIARSTIVAGAILFAVSDLFVARHRFVREQFANRLLGLPLYYAGQFLLAFSIGLIE